jgi:predicted metal-binding protein
MYCKECVLEVEERGADLSFKRDCRHSEKVRSSMEAVGIDVFATARKPNLPIDVIPCEDNVHGRITTSNINSYGLLPLF